MKPILEIQNISKSFQIRHENHSYLNLRDSLTSFFKSNNVSNEDFYALKNISFNVEKGDTLGILGRNGAGKSTLLKILSKITPPDSGKIISRGRIASLLEVGTGFHAELSGRENIYMNGSILGMRKAEINKNFDEIVNFAGVEKFLDTPLKHYSSGMQLRLAFAVAAFLENEILIIDEVLAVGDADFQQKCMGKMGEISKSGRTILFVSHNISAVKNLCNKGIVLNSGEMAFQGNATEAIQFYQTNNKSSHNYSFNEYDEITIGNENIKILSFGVKPLTGEIIDTATGFIFELTFYNALPNINLDATFELSNIEDQIIFHGGVIVTDSNNSEKGVYKIKCEFPPNVLNANIYQFKILFGKNRKELLFSHNKIVQFEILNEKLGQLHGNTLPGILTNKVLRNINQSFERA
jgi:lipopolysaccharide transport system ATP-binding protein